MSLLDSIKIKSQQIAMKTDQFIREHGVMAGMSFGAASIIVGIAGVAAMSAVAVPGAVVAAPIAAAASLASGTGLTVLGVSVNAAGAAFLAGGGGGIAFSALSKAYKTIRNKGVFNDALLGYHEMKCLDNNNQLQSVPAMKFFEMVEKGTLKNEFKEVVGRIHLGNGVHEERRYSSDLTLEQASYLQGEQDCEKIRRLLFKETNDMSFAQKLKDKMKSMRSNLSSSNSMKPNF